MNSINRLSDATGANNPADYQEDAYVHQLDRDGSTLRSYKFKSIFPTNISTIDLSYETTDTIEEFTVTFAVPPPPFITTGILLPSGIGTTASLYFPSPTK